MIRAGLTGSIGMGKSTTARLFTEAGIPVFDADAEVHALYAQGGSAVGPIRDRFPGSVKDGAVDRAALSKALQADTNGFADLEAIVHPLVGQRRGDFIAESEAAGAALVVFDIPLLFETGQADAYDIIIVVSAPAEVQAQRVLSRPGMTDEKFAAILARQMPDAEKRRRADYIIDSSTGIEDARRQVGALIETLIGGPKQPEPRPMREIVFDTETTGLDPQTGDRVTEIGCVEVIDYIPTGRTFHTYVNPERDVPQIVTDITGLTAEFLADKPLFAEIVDKFMDFVGDAGLVAHNAPFDRGFINMELARLKRAVIADDRFRDTVAIARKKFPGSPASLDALCKRFNISLDSREKHGALTDAVLLADVYLELNGGRERALDLAGDAATAGMGVQFPARPARPVPLAARSSDAERTAHAEFVSAMGDGDTVWKRTGGL